MARDHNVAGCAYFVEMCAFSYLLTSFHPEMALFRNLGVNPRDRLCDVPMYVSAQSLDFFDLANPAVGGLNWKLTLVPMIWKIIYGWALAGFLVNAIEI